MKKTFLLLMILSVSLLAQPSSLDKWKVANNVLSPVNSAWTTIQLGTGGIRFSSAQIQYSNDLSTWTAIPTSVGTAGGFTVRSSGSIYNTTAGNKTHFRTAASDTGSTDLVHVYGAFGATTLSVKANPGGTDPADCVASVLLGDNATYSGGLLQIKNIGNRGNIGNVNGSTLFRADFTDATAMLINKSGNVLIGSTTDNGQKLQVAGSVSVGAITASGVATLTTSTYADNTTAKAGGLTTGQVYKTSTGQLMIVY